METKKLIKELETRFPKKLAKRYHDYVGLMCGHFPKECTRVFVCLDFDETIYDEMIRFHPDIIITHHPLLFGNKKKILKYNSTKRNLVNKLAFDDIPVYSMHTNFDCGDGGMNDALSHKLGLKNIRKLDGEPCARGGDLPEAMDVQKFASFAKEKLGADYGLLLNYGPKEIKNVAIIGGGASADYKIAQKQKYDIYISGDIKHNIRRDIIVDKYNYLDLPHEIEKIFMPTMKKILLSIDKSLEIKIVDHEKQMKVI